MIDNWFSIGRIIPIFIRKFSSKEIESQYNLIKMLLAEHEKYRDAIDAIKKDIAYMPIELKKKLEEEKIILWMNRTSHKHNR